MKSEFASAKLKSNGARHSSERGIAMSIEKLRTTVSELEQVLRGIKSLDNESRQALEQAVQEIRAALQQETQSEVDRQSLVERLRESVERFESIHPSLTAVLGRLIDGLGQMGI
jgi:phosphoglycerate-specific signal transduction histidine kinase